MKYEHLKLSGRGWGHYIKEESDFKIGFGMNGKVYETNQQLRLQA